MFGLEIPLVSVKLLPEDTDRSLTKKIKRSEILSWTRTPDCLVSVVKTVLRWAIPHIFK